MSINEMVRINTKRTICSVLCKSGKFETGQGTCAAICMDQLGDARAKPCRHLSQVHDDLAEQIMKALEQQKVL